MSALLRRMLEREVLVETTKRNYSQDAIMAFVGLGRSDRGDISENHDEALAEALRDDAAY